MDLPARSDDERGRAPDYGVITTDRVWLIELKTERGDHLPAQLPAYVQLGLHHHPGLALDLTLPDPATPWRACARGGARSDRAYHLG